VIRGVFGPEVVAEPVVKAPLAIPPKPIEIVAHRVKGPLMGALVDGLMYNILADLFETGHLE
jgi:hypothetical protein